MLCMDLGINKFNGVVAIIVLCNCVIILQVDLEYQSAKLLAQLSIVTSKTLIGRRQIPKSGHCLRKRLNRKPTAAQFENNFSMSMQLWPFRLELPVTLSVIAGYRSARVFYSYAIRGPQQRTFELLNINQVLFGDLGVLANLISPCKLFTMTPSDLNYNY